MVYSFVCEECGEEFEIFLNLEEFEKFKDKNVDIKCPKCSSEKVDSKITCKCNFKRFWDKL